MVRRHSSIFLLLVVVGWACTSMNPMEDTLDGAELGIDTVEEQGPQTLLVVLDTFMFQAEQEPGVVIGFNLDDRISEEGDPDTCGKADQISPDGEPGIDNQLAKVVPLFELFGVGAVLNYVQNAIEGGGFLLMLEIQDVDDFSNDDSVRIVLRAGYGTPLLGTDGRLLAGQTFHLHDDSPDVVIENAYIEDSFLRAGPFEATIPFVILGMSYELTFHEAQIRARLTDEGWLEDGVMGGGVSYQDLYAIGEVAAADDASVLPAIEGLFQGMGDLAQDANGDCQQVSTAVSISAVNAFFYTD
ncbi:MAG: hypothetical protein CMH54_12360 [Myxococcales bacterium]|nr:hypothetical protein [Myxococcales bacterium]